MKIEELVPIEYREQRVLTGKQVAELYGVEQKRIKDNFKSNKRHFVEGVHFFKVEGETLRALKEQVNEETIKKIVRAQQDENFGSGSDIESPLSTCTRAVILYTAKGCVRHCKSLNSPTAWKVFGELEQSYFNQSIAVPVQSVLPLPEPVVEKATVYVFYLSSNTTKIGVTNDITDRARTIERQSGFKVLRIHNSDFIDRSLALAVEKSLHTKFNAQRLEGEFFSVTFVEACREMERALAELHIFEPLALPDVNLADKLLVVAAGIQNPDAKDKVLLHAANLIVGQELF